MIRAVVALVMALLVAGCSHVPFKETPPVSLKSVEPARLLEDFRAGLPEHFQLLNSVVFEYSGASFMGIGYLDIDRRENLFKVACLNPMGIQLFELSGDRATITTHAALPVLMQYGDLPTAVGTDIRRIFFDLLPAGNAQSWKSKYTISFWQPSGPGRMQYVFAGAGHDLVEKNYYENNEIAWGVSYYEYIDLNGKRYPKGIILINYQRGYRLTVRHKELYS